MESRERPKTHYLITICKRYAIGIEISKYSDAFNFQTSEGMAVSAEVGITYHLRAESIPIIFQRYRRGMDEITDVFIRNYIRDAINKSASKTKIEDMYIGKESFFEDVEAHVRARREKLKDKF